MMSGRYNFFTHSIKEKVSPNSFFFHQHQFASRRTSTDNIICFSFLRNDSLIAKIYFSINNNIAKSLNKSPFGSVDYAPDITDEELRNFIKQVIDKLSQRRLERLKIISYPKCYDQSCFELIHKAYLEAGFSIAYTEITQYLETTNSFRSKIQNSEKRYLNNALKRNYHFELLDTVYLKECYNLIKSTREHKNYPVTMSFDELERTIKQFPDNYLLFGLFDQQQLIATSICVHVNKNILYNFYNGDHLAYRKHSPLVPLMSHLHRYASTKDCKIIDLGVATEKGLVNTGLFNFKENLGGRPSEKPVYELCL